MSALRRRAFSVCPSLVSNETIQEGRRKEKKGRGRGGTRGGGRGGGQGGERVEHRHAEFNKPVLHCYQSNITR